MALFSWLADLVAQLLEREGIVAPQRRRWNLRGNGWDVRDDPDNERLDIFIDGYAVINQEAPETLLIVGDGLAATHDFLRELRRGTNENTSNVSLVGDIQSPNGYHSAVASDTLATIETRITALTIDEPTAILILAGRNDIDNGDSASTIAAAFVSLFVAIRAKWARSFIIVGDPTRWYIPALDPAAKTVVAEALYTILPVITDLPRMLYVPSGSLLDEDSIDATGEFPNVKGYALLASAFIPAVQIPIPPIYGRKVPRGHTQRISRPIKAHHLRRASLNNISFPSPATGTGTFAVAFWFYPDGILKNEHRVIESVGAFSMVTSERDLILRTTAGADIVGVDALTIREWNRLAIVLEAGRVRFYVNGQLRGLEVEAGLHSWDVTATVAIGSAIVSSPPGWFADVAFSDAAMSDNQARNDYRDATGVPRNVIARYLLGGLADEMGGAAATNTGMEFSDAGPLLPGELLAPPTYSPEEDTDITYWWRADMGVADDEWSNQSSSVNADFIEVAGGFPELLRGEGSLFNGKEALSFATCGDETIEGSDRYLRTTETFDFLTDYGFALCVALLKHSSSGADYEVVLSNKTGVPDLNDGFRLSILKTAGELTARVHIGKPVNATIIAAEQVMRSGAPELITFRFAADSGGEWRLETMKGVNTAVRDDPPALGASSPLHLGVDAPEVDRRTFRGQTAEIVLFQNASAATLDASVASWRTYAERYYGIKP